MKYLEYATVKRDGDPVGMDAENKMIESKRLTLAPLYGATNYVARNTSRWLNDPRTVRYSEQRHLKHTPKSVKLYWRRFNFLTNAIWTISHGRDYIGNISIDADLNNRTADIGILIKREAWGKGYATEAWSRLADYLLFERKFHKIEAGCMANNAGMIKVFKNCGMKYEGRRVKHFQFAKNKRVDAVYYGKFK